MQKELNNIANELIAIKKLLILLLQNSEIKNMDIANVLGISSGRLTQILDTRKYGSKK